jgi:hypothetical protein
MLPEGGSRAKGGRGRAGDRHPPEEPGGLIGGEGGRRAGPGPGEKRPGRESEARELAEAPEDDPEGPLTCGTPAGGGRAAPPGGGQGDVRAPRAASSGPAR